MENDKSNYTVDMDYRSVTFSDVIDEEIQEHVKEIDKLSYTLVSGKGGVDNEEVIELMKSKYIELGVIFYKIVTKVR